MGTRTEMRAEWHEVRKGTVIGSSWVYRAEPRRWLWGDERVPHTGGCRCRVVFLDVMFPDLLFHYPTVLCILKGASLNSSPAPDSTRAQWQIPPAGESDNLEERKLVAEENPLRLLNVVWSSRNVILQSCGYRSVVHIKVTVDSMVSVVHLICFSAHNSIHINKQ